MRSSARHWLLALSLLAAACGKPYEVATPDGFIDVSERAGNRDSSAHEYRAATADGVILGVRAWDNDPPADLTIAVRALENRIRFGDGAALLTKSEVVAKDGTKGMRLDFGHDESSTPHLYTVCVFVTDDHVYLVEAGGKKELFERARPSIDWFLKNFDPS